MAGPVPPPPPPKLVPRVEVNAAAPPPPPPPPPLTSVAQNTDLVVPQAKTVSAQGTEEETKEWFQDEVDLVPTEFVWSEDFANQAKEVKISGSWNGWLPIEMFRESEGTWSVITKVPVGTHEFKFIVDGEWRISVMHPSTDGDGDPAKINNIRVVTGKGKDDFPRHSIYRTMKNSRCCTIT